MNIANWYANTYTNDTWTDLISQENATLATLTFSNTAGSAVNIEIRLTDSLDNLLVVLMPLTSVASNDANFIDVRSINILDDQKLQYKVDATGAEIFASGVTY